MVEPGPRLGYVLRTELSTPPAVAAEAGRTISAALIVPLPGDDGRRQHLRVRQSELVADQRPRGYTGCLGKAQRWPHPLLTLAAFINYVDRGNLAMLSLEVRIGLVSLSQERFAKSRRQRGGPALRASSKTWICYRRLFIFYLHSTVKSSNPTVTMPPALKVMCAVSLTRKLFPVPAPIIRKRFMNVSFA
jgi:hypothetical protein